jgi:hypothetical protein
MMSAKPLEKRILDSGLYKSGDNFSISVIMAYINAGQSRAAKSTRNKVEVAMGVLYRGGLVSKKGREYHKPNTNLLKMKWNKDTFRVQA